MIQKKHRPFVRPQKFLGELVEWQDEAKPNADHPKFAEPQFKSGGLTTEKPKVFLTKSNHNGTVTRRILNSLTDINLLWCGYVHRMLLHGCFFNVANAITLNVYLQNDS